MPGPLYREGGHQGRRPADDDRCDQAGLEECEGDIEHVWSESGLTRLQLCHGHALARLKKMEKMRREYPDSPIPPAWFDPDYAGETWDDEM